MPAAWTTRSLLAWMTQDFNALGLGTPRLDAEVLVAHVLGVDRVRLYMDLDRPLANDELSAVRELVKRRRQREPVAYLTGKREFYRREFQVSPAVLIPRPDTETLIERALTLLPADQPLRVLDLCTGSGAIAVTLAAERPDAQVVATDLSAAALEIAAANARKHGVSERLELRQGDLFEALSAGAKFELIAANPPYVRDDERSELAGELHHEPALALYGGAEGLDVLQRLCAQVADWLAPGGVSLFEVGAGQAPGVLQLLAADARLDQHSSHRDLGGIERVLEAHLRAAGAPC